MTNHRSLRAQGKGSNKKRKLAPLRCKRRSSDEAPGAQEDTSSEPPASVGEIAFRAALHDHETESRDEDHNYDDYYDNGDLDGDNNDGDEDEEDEDPVVRDKERLAQFSLTVAAAFEDYMMSREGGEKPIDYVKLAVKRLWAMLDGTYHLRHSPHHLEPTEVAVRAWIMSLVEIEFAKISKYLDDLARRKGLRPNTIKTYLTSSFVPFFVYYRLFSLVVPQPSPDSYARLHVVLKSLVASYRKLAKTSRRLETMTVEQLIANRQWPPGGIAELQAAFLEHLPHIMCAFDEGVETYTHNDDFLRSFMELMMFGKILHVHPPPHLYHRHLISFLYSSLTHHCSSHSYSGFYAFAPQGRPGGINDLSLEDGEVLLASRKSIYPASSSSSSSCCCCCCCHCHCHCHCHCQCHCHSHCCLRLPPPPLLLPPLQQYPLSSSTSSSFMLSICTLSPPLLPRLR